ncbi:MAG: hypothetical protein LBB36_00150 [Fibromonadaceae bacterium]|nr:hypothetical protein [Fibromonadaceae bacterium]
MHAYAYAIAILAPIAFAINNVAVLELLPNESVQKAISIEESRHLTDELRRQAVMNLPKNEYSVLTRDNIIALIPSDEKEAECLAEKCAIEIGRAIGAEYITQGTIGKFGKKLAISVELYETMGGKLLSSIVFESEDIEGLLNIIRSEARPLFYSIFDGTKEKVFLRNAATVYLDISGNEGNYSDMDKQLGIQMQEKGCNCTITEDKKGADYLITVKTKLNSCNEPSRGLVFCYANANVLVNSPKLKNPLSVKIPEAKGGWSKGNKDKAIEETFKNLTSSLAEKINQTIGEN